MRFKTVQITRCSDAPIIDGKGEDIAWKSSKIIHEFFQIDPKELDEADIKCKEAEAWVESSRRKLSEVAGRSGAWIEKHQKARHDINEIRLKLDPKR